jgi:hypothetical protein
MIKKIKEKTKEYWQWVVALVVAILGVGVLASKKRDSKTIVKVGDGEIEKKRSEKIINSQTEIYEKHNEKRSTAEREFKEKSEKIKNIKTLRQKELENDSEKLDRILKERHNLKGE